MDITLNNIENIETSRRNLLKYGSLAGISAIAGINMIHNSLSLPNITTSSQVTSSARAVDYKTMPYNVFVVSENINQGLKMYMYTAIHYMQTYQIK